MSAAYAANRLQEIQEEMLELLDEAKELLREHDPEEWERAKGYWYPAILKSLDKEEWGSSGIDMGQSIRALREED